MIKFVTFVLLLPHIFNSSLVSLTLEQCKKSLETIICNQCQNCTFNLQNIKNKQTDYFSPSNITNNALGIQNVEVIKETVTSTYQFPKQILKRDMQYIAIKPVTLGCYNGVILYLHGTIFGKSSQPSSFPSNVKAIGGLFASQGFCIIFPDLLGYSQKYPKQPHPYTQNYEQNIQSSVLALNDFYEKNLNNKENVSLNVIGFSQGASYAILFEQCAKQNNLTQCSNQKVPINKKYTLKSVVSLSGQLSLDNVMLQFLKSDVGIYHQGNKFKIGQNFLTNFAKPSLSIMALASFQYYNYQGNSDLTGYVSSSFYTITCGQRLSQQLCNDDENHAQFLHFCLTSKQSSMDIVRQIGFSSFGKTTQIPSQIYLNDTYPAILVGHQNNIKRLFGKSVDNEYLIKLYKRASAMNYSPSVRHLIFFLNRDSSVPPLNSQQYIEKYMNTGRLTYIRFLNQNQHACRNFMSYVKAFSIDHVGSQIIGSIYALKFIKQAL